MDEVPVGIGANGGNAALPDEFMPQSNEQPDFTQISSHELLTHRSDWKARRAGYERVAASGAASPDAEVFFGLLSSTLVKETNAAAAETLVETLAFLLDTDIDNNNNNNNVDLAEAQPSRVALAAECCAGFLIERALQSAKPKVVASATTVLRIIIRGGHGPQLLAKAQSFLSFRNPKTRARALFTLNVLAEEVGIETLPRKDFFAAVFPLFNDADPKVRKEAHAICSTCYLQSPASVRSVMGTLREAQQQELNKAFEQIDANRDALMSQQQEKQQQQMATQKQALAETKGAAPAASSQSNNNNNNYASQFTAAAPARPVRFLAALHMKDIVATALDKSLKWQERIEPVNTKLLPKLQQVEAASPEDDYADMTKFFKELIVDRQLPLEQAGHRCIVELGRALGAVFVAHYARYVVPALFDKFKDKKTFAPALRTLLALYEHKAIVLESCDDLLDEGLSSKVPQQRLATLECIAKMAAQQQQQQNGGGGGGGGATPAELKSALARCTAALVRTASDDKADVREAFVVCVQALLEKCGVNAFRDVLAEVDEKVRRRILLKFEDNVNEDDNGGFQAPPPPVALAPAPVSARPKQQQQRRPVSPPPAAAPAQKQHRQQPVQPQSSFRAPSSQQAMMQQQQQQPSSSTMQANGNLPVPLVQHTAASTSASARSSLAVFPPSSNRNSVSNNNNNGPSARNSAAAAASSTAGAVLAEMESLDSCTAWPDVETCVTQLTAALPNISMVNVPDAESYSRQQHQQQQQQQTSEQGSRNGSRASSVDSSSGSNNFGASTSSFMQSAENSVVFDESNSTPMSPFDAAALFHASWRIRERAWRSIGDAIEANMVDNNKNSSSNIISGEKATSLAECLVRYGFKHNSNSSAKSESVVQVANCMLHAVQLLLNGASSVPLHVAAALVTWVLPRYSDAKVKAHVGSLLSLLTEHLGPQSMFRFVCGRAQQLKVPKVMSEALEWVELSVREFRESPIDIGFLVHFATDFVFSSSQCPQPAVRNAGVKLVVTLILTTSSGARLRAQLQQQVSSDGSTNVTSHLLQHIDSELAKRKRADGGGADDDLHDSVASPRSQRHHQMMMMQQQQQNHNQQQQQQLIRPSPAAGAVGKAVMEQHHLGANSQSSFVMSAMNSMHHETNEQQQQEQQQPQHQQQEEVPRYDISHEVRPLIQDLTSGKDWRDRLAALKKIEKLVTTTAQGHIQSAGVPELMKALKQRLDESSKNFVHDALRVMHLVIRAASASAGGGARAGAKAVMVAVLNFLGDQKPQLRDEALSLGRSLFEAVGGVEPVVGDLVRLLNVESPYAKAGLLELLVQRLGGNNNGEQGGASGELENMRFKALAPLIGPVLKLLTDRSSDVRTSATELLSAVVFNCGGAEPLLRVLSTAKPADALVLQPIIEKAAASRRPVTPPPAAAAAPTSARGGGGAAASSAQKQQPQQQPMYPLPPSSSAPSVPVVGPQQQQQQQQQQNHYADPNTMVNDAYAAPPPAYLQPQNPANISHHDDDDEQQQQQQQMEGGGSFHHHPASPIQNNSMHQQQQQYQYSADNIIQNMNRANNAGVEKMCVAVMHMAQDPQQHHLLCTRLVLALLSRLRNETSVRETVFDANVVGALLNAVVECFTVTDLVTRLDANFLFQLVGNVLELLSCPLLVQPGRDRAMIRSVNQLALRMIQNSSPEAIFEAIMTRLMWHVGEYIDAEGGGGIASNGQHHHHHHGGDNHAGAGSAASAEKMKTVETVIRCLFRIDLKTVSIDTVVRGIHEFLTRFPPSHFRNRNDLPIRSVKMVLGNMCKEHEAELIRARCRDLIGPSSLVYSFVHMCLDQLQNGASPTPHPSSLPAAAANSQQQQSQQQQHHSASPPKQRLNLSQNRSRGGGLAERAPNQHASPHKMATPQKQQSQPLISFDALSQMFALARKHETAEEGVNELAAYVGKYSRTQDFDALYQRCSEAFRMYLDRRIERILSSQ